MSFIPDATNQVEEQKSSTDDAVPFKPPTPGFELDSDSPSSNSVPTAIPMEAAKPVIAGPTKGFVPDSLGRDMSHDEIRNATPLYQGPEMPRSINKYYDPMVSDEGQHNPRTYILDQSFKQGLYGHVLTDADKWLQTQHPVVSAIGQGMGQLIGLMGVGTGVGGMVEGAAQVAIKKEGLSLIPWIQGAANIGKGAGTFGIKEALDKLSKSMQGQPVNGEDLKDVAKQTALGAGLGATDVIANPISRISAQAMYGYGTSKMMGATDTNAVVNGFVNALFGLTNRVDLNHTYKRQAVTELHQNLATKLNEQGVPIVDSVKVADEMVYGAAMRATGEDNPHKAVDEILKDPSNNLEYFDELNKKIMKIQKKDKLNITGETPPSEAPPASSIEPVSPTSPTNPVQTSVTSPIQGMPPTAGFVEEPLPKDLQGAKPRYNFGSKAFVPEFESDIDKALFITAQKKPSARDADYRAFLKSQGFSEDEINQHGATIRDNVKALAKNSVGGTLAEPQTLTVSNTGLTPSSMKATPVENYTAPQVLSEETKKPWQMTKDEYEASGNTMPYEQMISQAQKSPELNESPGAKFPTVTFKIKMGAEWKINVGQGRHPDLNKGQQSDLPVGNASKTKKLTAAEFSQGFKDNFDDVTIKTENIDGQDYMVMSGTPKPDKSKARGKLSSFFNASMGSHSIDSAEIMKMFEMQQPFKLSTAVKELVKKYVPGVIGEGYNPSGTSGAFFRDTGNIFLSAYNDVHTAVHEVAHSIDAQGKILEPIKTPVTYAKNGNPIYNSKEIKLRKALTESYVNYYPSGNADHPLSKRVDEGYAVFITNAITQPERTKKEFPLLWKMFLDKKTMQDPDSGTYYNANMNDFIRDAQVLIGRYQALSDQHKIESRMMEVLPESDAPALLNQIETLTMNELDDASVFENLAADAKVAPASDPSLFFRAYRTIPSILQHNIGNLGLLQSMVGIKKTMMYFDPENNWEPIEKFNFNWKTIVEKPKNITAYKSFLLARYGALSWRRLDAMAADAQAALLMIENLKKDHAAGLLKKTEAEDAIGEQQEILNEYTELKQRLEEDGIDRGVLERDYEARKDEYVEEVKMHDQIKRADLDLQYAAGLRTKKQYDRLLKNEGYVTMFRHVSNELEGESETRSAFFNRGAKAVKSSKARVGGQQNIQDPLYNSIIDHFDTMRKAWRQVCYNSLMSIIPHYPALFQPLPLERSYNPQSHSINYPQDQDPNVIMLRVGDGQRYPVFVRGELKDYIDEFFTPMEANKLTNIILKATSVFVKGTTGMNPFYAVKNVVIDQPTAWFLGKKYTPLVTPLNELRKVLSSFARNGGDEYKYALEYLIMGGERHTFISLESLEPKDGIESIRREAGAINQAVHMLHIASGSLMEILTMPVKISELISKMVEYIRNRSAGDPFRVAFEKAGRITIPFHHKGRYGLNVQPNFKGKPLFVSGKRNEAQRFLIRVYPYLAAQLQAVTTTMGKMFNKRLPAQERQEAMFKYLLITAAMVAAAYYHMQKASPKQKRMMANLTPTEISSGIYYPSSDGQDLGKFPVAQDLTGLSTILNMMVMDQVLNAKYDTAEYLEGATTNLPDQMNITNPFRMAISIVTPQPAIPWEELLFNKKFYPEISDLVPDHMKVLPSEDRYFANTSEWAKNAAKNPFAKKMDMSPIQIDEAVRSVFGVGGSMVTGKQVNLTAFFKKDNLSGREVEFYYKQKQQVDLQKNIEKKAMDGDITNATSEKSDALQDIDRQFTELKQTMKDDKDEGKDPEKNPEVVSSRREISKAIHKFHIEYFRKK